MGMRQEAYLELRSSLLEALRRDNIDPDLVEIRLHDSTTDTQPLNGRPQESMHNLGLGEPSAIDISISSPQMLDRACSAWDPHAYTGPLSKDGGHLNQGLVENEFPSLYRWAEEWSTRAGREMSYTVDYPVDHLGAEHRTAPPSRLGSDPESIDPARDPNFLRGYNEAYRLERGSDSSNEATRAWRDSNPDRDSHSDRSHITPADQVTPRSPAVESSRDNRVPEPTRNEPARQETPTPPTTHNSPEPQSGHTPSADSPPQHHGPVPNGMYVGADGALHQPGDHELGVRTQFSDNAIHDPGHVLRCNAICTAAYPTVVPAPFTNTVMPSADSGTP
ncbi:hypothetical protein ACWEO2_41760, partial [Nocardia sp. NPDC004278]